MPVIHLAALFGVLLSVSCYLCFCLGDRAPFVTKTKNYQLLPCLVFFLALLARLAAAARSEGFGSDMACFAAWSERMYETGPSGFYSPEVFTDYPPGYMYILWLIGWLRHALGIPLSSALHLTLLRLPAIICDLACGGLLYRKAAGKLAGAQALCLCCAYLFNPVILLNSAVWGQVDSVFTLALLLMCFSLVSGRLFPAYLAFCAGLLIKPQMLLFSPILLAGVADQVFLCGFSLRRLGRQLMQALLSLAMLLGLSLPFGADNVWRQSISTVSAYPYAAVNACNFWGMLGLNWVSQDTILLGLPCKLWGYLFILLATATVLAVSLRHRNDREKYPFLAALLILTLFVFSVRMHERYLYPGLILLLSAIVYRPAARAVWLCYGSFSLLHFYNTAYVLFLYDPGHFDRKSPLLLLVSAGMVLAVLAMHHLTAPQYFSGRKREEQDGGSGKYGSNRSDAGRGISGKYGSGSSDAGRGASGKYGSGRYAPRPSLKKPGLKKADLFWITAVTLVYSCFALYDLGDTSAPESAYNMACGDSVTLYFDDAGQGQEACFVACYIAPGHNRSFLAASGADGEWTDPQEISFQNVFTWQETALDAPGASIRLTLMDDRASLLELIFLDADGRVLTPSNASDYPALFDEQHLWPGRSSFRDSMYFDEIYHGRTAYEFLHGLPAYETTHPPLGKLLISTGIALFGMNPFGWRIAGTFFGILMIPVIYLSGKYLTGKTPAAALACVLFAFDFMHFTQTRIATIDVYITFFVMLMYFFMYCYCRFSFYDTPLSKTFLPLGACGVCMGLGIACKWTGVYAGAGLAVIFFAVLHRRYQEYRHAQADPEGTSGEITHAHVLQVFFPHTVKTICFCLVFFVAVPGLIYLLSYLPFDSGSSQGLFARMLQNQADMYLYHSTLDAAHPYSSPWYTWPIIRRPIWYYSSIVSGSQGTGGLREGISAFGSPLVWWPGIPAAFHMLWLWIRKKDRNAAFLLTGYLAQYLPWFFVTRITFIYHYFPSVPFVALMIVHSLLEITKKLTARQFLTLTALYGTAAFLLFLLFYPVLAGQAVDYSHVDHWLRWFDSWVLAAP